MNPTNGKGSTPRKVDQEKYANNWDHIFNKEYPDDQLGDNPDPKPVDETED